MTRTVEAEVAGYVTVRRWAWCVTALSLACQMSDDRWPPLEFFGWLLAFPAFILIGIHAGLYINWRLGRWFG
jgi:hypothetical protein